MPSEESLQPQQKQSLIRRLEKLVGESPRGDLLSVRSIVESRSLDTDVAILRDKDTMFIRFEESRRVLASSYKEWAAPDVFIQKVISAYRRQVAHGPFEHSGLAPGIDMCNVLTLVANHALESHDIEVRFLIDVAKALVRMSEDRFVESYDIAHRYESLSMLRQLFTKQVGETDLSRAAADLYLCYERMEEFERALEDRGILD